MSIALAWRLVVCAPRQRDLANRVQGAQRAGAAFAGDRVVQGKRRPLAKGQVTLAQWGPEMGGCYGLRVRTNPCCAELMGPGRPR